MENRSSGPSLRFGMTRQNDTYAHIGKPTTVLLAHTHRLPKWCRDELCKQLSCRAAFLSCLGLPWVPLRACGPTLFQPTAISTRTSRGLCHSFSFSTKTYRDQEKPRIGENQIAKRMGVGLPLWCHDRAAPRVFKQNRVMCLLTESLSALLYCFCFVSRCVGSVISCRFEPLGCSRVRLFHGVMMCARAFISPREAARALVFGSHKLHRSVRVFRFF